MPQFDESLVVFTHALTHSVGGEVQLPPLLLLAEVELLAEVKLVLALVPARRGAKEPGAVRRGSECERGAVSPLHGDVRPDQLLGAPSQIQSAIVWISAVPMAPLLGI